MTAKRRSRLFWIWIVCVLRGAAADGEFFDRVRNELSVSAADDALRARLSGTLEFEYYHFSAPAPGLIYSNGESLVAPRVPLFVDVQYGESWYTFAQVRFDRGFDPANGALRGRVDELAARWRLAEGALNFEAGKFATIVGNWAPRHGAWENPFITAPLVYENLTGIWDSVAVRSSATLLRWAHVRPVGTAAEQSADKLQRLPVIWGPSYASGLAVFGRTGALTYALEMKNAALSSRPGNWGVEEGDWKHPTVSGRVAYSPNPMWVWGVSASSGPYLQPSARATLAPGSGLGDYRERLAGADVEFAWHHLQVWAEAYVARFRIPRVADVAVTSYYLETKYKFTPQWFGSVRWGEERFGDISDGAGRAAWGRQIARGEVALGYRWTANVQTKVQFGAQHESVAAKEASLLAAVQFVVRF